MTVTNGGYICPACYQRPTHEPEDVCPGCSLWFPKPPDCTCAYDAGWIYEDEACPAHRGHTPPIEMRPSQREILKAVMYYAS